MENELLLSKSYGAKRYKKKGKIIKCKSCGKDVYAQPSESNKQYCSRKCMGKGTHTRKPRKGKVVKCDGCGKEYYLSPSLVNKFTTHFCSRNCRKNYDYGGKIELVCIVCDKKYKTYKSHQKHRGSSCCSMECLREKQKRSRKPKNKQRYKKSAWRIFSQYVRARDNYICISCGKQLTKQTSDAGHYIPKTAGLSLYFDERNVNCQCTYCNRFMHGNLSKYAIELRKKYGESILEDLDKDRQKIIKYSEDDYLELMNHYKNKLKEMGVDFK